MKKFIIIGDPISHSLSPKIHNFWFVENNIIANYDKIKPRTEEIKKIINKIKTKEINGMNVTVPFKQTVIPFLETKSEIVEQTNSVNTIFNKDGKIHGDNTDVYGFEKSALNHKLDLKNKNALIFGAGGVVPSIITALKNLEIGKIFLTNRTIANAKLMKNKFQFIELIEWGNIENCDLFINCTSIGLNKEEKFNLDFKNLTGKKIFYDVIYNPPKTIFLSDAEKLGHKIINGRDMFLYQAQKAFNLWHNISPIVNKRLEDYLYNG